MSTRDDVIQGGRQLDELLQTLPTKMEKNILRAGMRAGAAVLLPEVKQRIPVDKGALARSARITTRAKKGAVSASVKVGNREAWYARLVEYGTKPHLIQVSDADRGINRKTGKRISMTTINRQRSLLIGGTLVGPSVEHPGSRPQPFMRPASDAALPAALRAVTDKIRERLTKQGLNTPPALPTDPEE